MKKFETQPTSNNSTSNEQLITLQNRLFDREVPEEYRRLAKNARLIELAEPYSENLHTLFYQEKGLTNLGKLISEAMHGGIVLDLGCGQTNHLSSFARKNEAELYIGVDLNPDVFTPGARMVPEGETIEERRERRRRLFQPATPIKPEISEESISSNVTRPKYQLKEKILQIQDDILEAISRMKDGLVDIVIISGIEMSSENIEETNKYLTALTAEIRRVLKKGGLLLNNQSDLPAENFTTIAINNEQGWIVQKNNN